MFKKEKVSSSRHLSKEQFFDLHFEDLPRKVDGNGSHLNKCPLISIKVFF